MRKVAMVLLGVAVPLLLGQAASAASVTRTYIGALPAGGPVTLYPISGYDGWETQVGGVWVPVPHGSSGVTVTVADAHGPVAADLLFVVDEYAPVVRGPQFCGGQLQNVHLPAGTGGMYVRILAAESATCDPAAVPTRGTVTVRFA